jgi:hypothetical protein
MLCKIAIVMLLAWVPGVVGVYDVGLRVHVLLLVGLLPLLLGLAKGRDAANSGVPIWWPAFCLAVDLGAAGGLAWVIKRRPGGYRELSRSA